ncbi:MAG: CZB domain-containing protein [Thermoleophilia bacterium]
MEGAGAQVAASAAELDRLVSGFEVSETAAAEVDGDDLGATIQAALSAHAAWKDRLHAAIDSGAADVTPDQVRVDDACAFGKWLHGPDAAAHRHHPAFGPVHDLHERFHAAAASVLERAVAGDTAEAAALMRVGSEFQKVSARLSQALLDWRATP